MADAISIEAGALLCYRIFEVGDEIDLPRAEALAQQSATRLKLLREGSQYLELPNPPLTLRLGQRTLPLRAREVPVEATARVFDHGAISVQLRMPLGPPLTWDELVRLVDEVYDSEIVDRVARLEVQGLQKTLEPAIQDPHLWESSETYTVVYAEKLNGAQLASEVLAKADLARLLLGEASTKPLSEHEQFDVTKHAYSYLQDDLAVVDWNSAFVYEPTGSMDIPNLLEIATSQLLELRYFDWLLDRELNRIYDEMAGARLKRWRQVLINPYGSLAREVTTLLLELTEFTERVENTLKVIGDFYLGRVYRAAVRRFRIPEWQASVYRKISLVERVYTLLKGEIDTRRTQLLEMTIVVLIVVEILLGLGIIRR